LSGGAKERPYRAERILRRQMRENGSARSILNKLFDVGRPGKSGDKVASMGRGRVSRGSSKRWSKTEGRRKGAFDS
jgi:hypothetical protein